MNSQVSRWEFGSKVTENSLRSVRKLQAQLALVPQSAGQGAGEAHTAHHTLSGSHCACVYPGGALRQSSAQRSGLRSMICNHPTTCFLHSLFCFEGQPVDPDGVVHSFSFCTAHCCMTGPPGSPALRLMDRRTVIHSRLSQSTPQGTSSYVSWCCHGGVSLGNIPRNRLAGLQSTFEVF